ncbi:hypothetical protein [Bifidobacterium olomucense]|uniref:Uncharacterized protein n=1 Tax=Bifidobacterium olomucense TaxID=2675324 RepID=A0A7Y0EXD0_9BIFI|nr:hypothetical protein [Bifidobacterium sp. DSM 109959]NMM98109.1 hypothetical protein [Bifidobacterium sp. DSM 109959]
MKGRSAYTRLTDMQKEILYRLISEGVLSARQIAEQAGCAINQVYTYRHKMKSGEEHRLTDISCLVLRERVSYIPEITVVNPDDVNGRSFLASDTSFDCSRCGFPMMAGWFTFKDKYTAIPNFNYCPNCGGLIDKTEES